jgi:hypothetical protein
MLTTTTPPNTHIYTEGPLASRLTTHSLLLQDKKITEILATAGNAVTLTIIPTVIYEHMVKK